MSEVWVAAEGDDEWSLLEVAPKPHLLRGATADTAVQVRTMDDGARNRNSRLYFLCAYGASTLVCRS